MGARGPQPGWKKGAKEVATSKADKARPSPRAVSKKPRPCDTGEAAGVPSPQDANPGEVAAQAANADAQVTTQATEHAEPMTAADQANPAKLTGEALKALAHSMGLAKSELADMSDERIREQLRYRVNHLYEAAEA